MERELKSIFAKTFQAHYPRLAGISERAYTEGFNAILGEELPFAPAMDTVSGPLAAYLKLSVLVLAMAKNLKNAGLDEDAIGKAIYATADRHFTLSPLKKFLRSRLFFSALNVKAIRKREALTRRSEGGVNGFRLRYVPGNAKGEFGVDYERCGIHEYFGRRGIPEYVKYCCLVDYAIMKNLGISFSRTKTIGNGADRCDFRFRKNGPITEGWPPCRLEEFTEGENRRRLRP